MTEKKRESAILMRNFGDGPFFSHLDLLSSYRKQQGSLAQWKSRLTIISSPFFLPSLRIYLFNYLLTKADAIFADPW